MVRAEVVLQEKTTDEQGNLRELVVWRVTPNARQPEGVRYRLALILAGEKTPAILYDNHNPKGNHRHVEGAEEHYEFVDIGRLIEDFMTDVRRVIGAGK